MKPLDVLEHCKRVWESRNSLYGSNYKYFGDIMIIFFPDGMNIETEEDFARAANLFRIITKLSRYCENFESGGHSDSMIDIINHCSIQEELDDDFNTSREEADKVGCRCETDREAESKQQKAADYENRKGPENRRSDPFGNPRIGRRSYGCDDRRTKKGTKADRTS